VTVVLLDSDEVLRSARTRPDAKLDERGVRRFVRSGEL